MKFKGLLFSESTKRIVCIVLLLVVAILSMTVVSRFATSPETYKTTIQSIDEKKAMVMGVTATAAVTSAALAAIPGDATTPIANKIMDLSAYLLIVVCALVLEKSLLTVIGYLSFNILIPISCIMLGIYTFIKKRTLKIIALKFIAFALVIVSIIPFSMNISDMIYMANQSTVEQLTIEMSEETSQETNAENFWLDKIIDKAREGVSGAGEKAKQILNNFIDAIALFIVAYCALPIIIILLTIWFINLLFKINIPIPDIKNIRKVVSKKNKSEEPSEEKELLEV